jgi:hypothetical protein
MGRVKQNVGGGVTMLTWKDQPIVTIGVVIVCVCGIVASIMAFPLLSLALAGRWTIRRIKA